MIRRTWISDAEVIGLPGEILVTLYPEGRMTIAYRETGSRTWGPPMIARETE
jgi:hypothetical protein